MNRRNWKAGDGEGREDIIEGLTTYEVLIADELIGPYVVAHVLSHEDVPLIAAAPELLALAERVAVFFEHTDAPLGEAARAAIAAARGETVSA